MSDIPTKDLPRPWPFMVQTEDPEADAAESEYCKCGPHPTLAEILKNECVVCGKPYA